MNNFDDKEENPFELMPPTFRPNRFDFPLDDTERNFLVVKPHGPTVGFKHVGEYVDTEISHMKGNGVELGVMTTGGSGWV